MSEWNYSREERKLQIVSSIARRLQRDNHNGMTQYELAKVLKMHPGGHLFGILKELESEGKLEREEFQHRPNKIGWYWKLAEGTYTNPHEKLRKVPVKKKGSEIGTLSMFSFMKLVSEIEVTGS